MNNNNNIGWLFFGGYKNILPSMLTILPSSSTRAILLTSLAIYSCIPLKAIQYYIMIQSGVEVTRFLPQRRKAGPQNILYVHRGRCCTYQCLNMSICFTSALCLNPVDTVQPLLYFDFDFENDVCINIWKYYSNVLVNICAVHWV